MEKKTKIIKDLQQEVSQRFLRTGTAQQDLNQVPGSLESNDIHVFAAVISQRPDGWMDGRTAVSNQRQGRPASN